MAAIMSALSASLRRHPWWWLAGALVLATVTVVPAIDITISSWFFAPERKIFPLRVHPFFEFIRKGMPKYLFGLAGLVAVLWLASEARRRRVLGIDRRRAAYLLGSLAIGPGLIVNVILKDNWGRPRPSMIQQFFGPSTYVPPLIPSAQCDDNCSFASGHASLAFWLVAFALLAPPRLRTPALVATLGFGGLVGFSRIAQGGHFLSDVLYAAAITVGVIFALYKSLIPEGQSHFTKK